MLDCCFLFKFLSSRNNLLFSTLDDLLVGFLFVSSNQKQKQGVPQDAVHHKEMMSTENQNEGETERKHVR